MLDYTKNKWDQITKVKDLLAFLEDPKADVMELMKTYSTQKRLKKKIQM